MESDERFKHLSTDPRFKPLRRKQRKVVIDDRFKSMFTDKRFGLPHRKDKRGNNIKSKSKTNDLKKFYSLEDNKDKKEDAKSDNEEEKEDEDEPANEDDDQTSSSEVSSSSDESESEEEADAEYDTIKYDWEALDHDAEIADKPTKRIAFQNFDWSQISAKDIYTIINSIRPPLYVTIYVSEFGKERLKREELEGPPEIVDMPVIDEIDEEYNQLKAKMDNLQPSGSLKKPNEFDDAEEDADDENDEIRERIRRYELNKLKYYYAVAEFDSIESAQLVYKELDGIEYEGSSIELDLRYIPEEMEFDDEDIKSTCDKLPDLTSYNAPQFISSALQQTKVEFSWDTDKKRQDKLQKAYTKEELEKDDLQIYLASDSENESSSDELVKSADTYKQLIENLEKENAEKEKVDLEVDFSDHSSQGEEEDDSETESSKPLVDEEKELLSLLVTDGDKGLSNFKFNLDDERFGAVYQNKNFNIDPSHPKFKKTEAFERIAERKRRKREEKNG